MVGHALSGAVATTRQGSESDKFVSGRLRDGGRVPLYRVRHTHTLCKLSLYVRHANITGEIAIEVLAAADMLGLLRLTSLAELATLSVPLTSTVVSV